MSLTLSDEGVKFGFKVKDDEGNPPNRFELPDGNLLVGGIFDVSGSMEEALVGSATRARNTPLHSQPQRANAVFRTLNLLVDVTKEEVERQNRQVRIFAIGVGTRSKLLGHRTCDLLDLLEQGEEMFYSLRFTIEDAVKYASKFGEKGENGGMWIRENVNENEIDDLMRYVKTHPDDAQLLVDSLPSATVSQAANILKRSSGAANIVSSHLGGGPGTAVGAGVGHGIVAGAAIGTVIPIFGTIFGAVVGGLIGGTPVAADQTVKTIARNTPSKARDMKNKFVELERIDRERRKLRGFRADRVSHVPRPRDVGVLHESLRFLRDEVEKTLLGIKKYIFGSTPLFEAMDHAEKVFNESGERGNVLFIVSDGIATDDPKKALECARRLHDMGVLIVTCFLCNDEIPKNEERKLFFKPRRGAGAGERIVFKMASGGMRCVENPVNLLVQREWSVPDEGECRLFFRANNLAIVEEFHALITSSLIQSPERSALGIASSIDWASFNNENVRNEPVLNQRDTGTCWLHALTWDLHVAMKQVIGRFGGCPSIPKIKNKLLEVYGEEPKKTTKEILAEVCDDANGKFNYRLRSREVNESEARQKFIRHRPVLATFHLHAKLMPDEEEEWDKFCKFFLKNPKGVLEAKDVLISKLRKGLNVIGHAVVLVDVGPDYLTFQNSWGRDWADEGRFRIKNSKVLGNMKFYYVFFEEDLLESEREAYKVHQKKLMKNLKKNFPALSRVYNQGVNDSSEESEGESEEEGEGEDL